MQLLRGTNLAVVKSPGGVRAWNTDEFLNHQHQPAVSFSIPLTNPLFLTLFKDSVPLPHSLFVFVSF